MNPKQKDISVQERMRLAREASEAKKLKEKQAEEAYYTRISSGTQWAIFKAFSFYCLALAALITVETLIDGETKKITPSQIQYEEALIKIGNAYYTPLYTEITGFLDTSFRVVQTPVFRADKYLVWTSGYQDSKTPLKYTDYDVWKLNSVYEYFIFVQVVLLIPIFFVWYKRPTPVFKFGRMLCLILIFPASIYLLFATIGIVNLLPIGA